MNNTPAPTIPFISLASTESLPKLIRKLVDKYDSVDGAKSGVPSLSTKNQNLSRMELGIPEATFGQYDVDSDGQLDFAELRQFVSACQPDLQIQLDVSQGKVEVIGSHQIEVRMTADGAANIQIGMAQLSVSAIPPTPGAAAESMIKPLFMAFDGDANGYLEKMEVPDNALPGATFADLDSDKNGKLFLEEVVDFLQPRLDLAKNRLELVITEQGRTLFDILDSDRDGRLARREIRKVRSKLNLWDSNQDGFLEESEIPLQFTMVAGQGTLPIFGVAQSDDVRGSRTPNTARPNGPTWFTKMDRNRDGEISRREFLGEPELFQKLDLNQDGAIELTEALMVKSN
jgi:Ca2+-binding EF-hand superfamily protein